MMAVEGKRKRPMRVTIIGILPILVGLIYLFPVLGIYGLGNLINMTGRTFQAGPLVLTAFIIAIANFILGLGCLHGWRPIWLYLVIISVINLVVALVALLNTNMNQWGTALIGMVWLVFVTYVLLTVQSKKIKEWFHC
jgi:hypothetical protein